MAQAQEILLVPGIDSLAEEQQIEEVAGFLGLSVRVAVPNAASGVLQRKDLGSGRLLAIFVAADAFPKAERFVERANRSAGGHVPEFIFGVDERTDRSRLLRWSQGRVSGCHPSAPVKLPAVLRAGVPSLAGPLVGVDLPVADAPVCDLAVSESQAVASVLTIFSQGVALPLLVRVQLPDRELYLAVRAHRFDRSWVGRPDGRASAFSSLAQWILPLKQLAGPFAWHLPRGYANLTVDDPRLVEPYGNLSYQSLLQQMQSHHFHTTIAFIPWNYNRNEEKAVEPFRDHPDLLSICLHGNNHAHREFGALNSHPLPEQTFDVEQGLARMEAFHRITGLPYDRFMVFPHGVAPQATFQVLHSYGFTGTANSLNVPLDQTLPSGPLYLLHPYTTNYAGILSLSRLSIEASISLSDLAIPAYWNDPILLYGHQEAFRDGARGVLSAVDAVNQIAPGTQWASLGTIARHLYELRQLDTAKFQVRPLSRELELRNDSSTPAEFDITPPIGPQQGTVAAILCNGSPGKLTRSQTGVVLPLMLAPGQRQLIQIRFADELAVPSVDIRGHELGVSLLRELSEFRDRTLSVHGWGRALISSYYGEQGPSLELRMERHWIAIATAAIAAATLIWLLFQSTWRQRRKTHLQTGRATP